VQAVLEREPHAEVGGEAQGADDLSGAQLLGRGPSTVRTHAAETTEDSPKLKRHGTGRPLHRFSSGRTAADIVIDLRPGRGSQREQLIRAQHFGGSARGYQELLASLAE
jgi:hypothetical protein